MLAQDAAWWQGEFGSLPHAQGDNRPAYINGKPTGANAGNYSPYSPPQNQAPQATGGSRTATDGSARPMPVWSSGKFSVPAGAQQNDLSGNVPSNLMWAQSWNQAAEQANAPSRVQSWTMPGYSSSRTYDPKTKTYSDPAYNKSTAGNMAYFGVDDRPSPVTSQARGVDGQPVDWMDSFKQRDAFVGGLINRLGQYQAGQERGRPTFDFGKIMKDGREQLANGTWSNPFMQDFDQITAVDPPYQPPGTDQQHAGNDGVQAVMQNAARFMRGNFRNPFGTGYQANNPMPSWKDREYDPTPTRGRAITGNDRRSLPPPRWAQDPSGNAGPGWGGSGIPPIRQLAQSTTR